MTTITKGQRSFLKLVHWNGWKILYRPDAKDWRARWTIGQEALSARVVKSLIALGYLEKTWEGEAGWQHWNISPAGTDAALAIIEEEKRLSVGKKKPTTRGRFTKPGGRFGKVPRRTKSWHRRNDSKMVKMRQDGVPVKEIAASLRTTKTTVRKVLRERGMMPERYSYRAETSEGTTFSPITTRDDEIVKRALKGERCCDIARSVDLPYQKVYRVLRRLGLTRWHRKT